MACVASAIASRARRSSCARSQEARSPLSGLDPAWISPLPRSPRTKLKVFIISFAQLTFYGSEMLRVEDDLDAPCRARPLSIFPLTGDIRAVICAGGTLSSRNAFDEWRLPRAEAELFSNGGVMESTPKPPANPLAWVAGAIAGVLAVIAGASPACLLYTSDAADE